MNRYQLFKTLRKHRKLAAERALNANMNKTAKYVGYIMIAFVFIYLIMVAIAMAFFAYDIQSMTSIEMLFACMPFILAIDFFMRFSMQQTPAHIVKPYILLPISLSDCINSFVASSLLSSGNLVWFALFLPYSLMAVLFSFGVWQTLAMLLLLYIMILANSQWYAIARTLVNHKMYWWILPIAVYAIIAASAFIGKNAGIGNICTQWANIGSFIHDANPLPFIVALALLIILTLTNRWLQMRSVWNELAHVERTQLHSVTQFHLLERFGIIGEYLKLEIKSILRNKNPRKTMISAAALCIFFSIIITFTTIYDTDYMANYWCLYCYTIFGGTILTRIMCYEGNYIDALMIRKENILAMLKAKYVFYCVILILPFLLMLPPVIAGKWSFLMLLAYALFTAGFQYFILFQLAVYNKQTVPLNTKFIAKNGAESNWFQVMAQLFALFCPVIVISLLQNIVSDNIAYLIALFAGLAFILTSNLWLRNIYNRMMKRKYEIIEALQASR